MPIVDGIKVSYSFECDNEYNQWKKSTAKIIRTWIPVYEDSGEIKAEEDKGFGSWRMNLNGKYKWYTILHTSRFQQYDLVIRETNYETVKTGKRHTSYRLELSGSITANYHGGENWKDLTFTGLQDELDKIELILYINLSKAKIDNIEPSICFELPFHVFSFLDKNVVSYYGNRPLNRYSKKKGIELGRYIELTDNTQLKVYDKSAEYSLPVYIMQYELHFKKMTALKDYGVRFLADLRCWNTVNGLLNVLVSYFDRLLLYDPSINKSDLRLTEMEREMIQRGRACEYWEDLKMELSNGTYYNRIKEFKALVWERLPQHD
jgi:hypothetical protein